MRVGFDNGMICRGGRMNIEDLLICFDKMGFVPTMLFENQEEYAREWKRQLVVEIERLKDENDYLKRTDEDRYEEAEANIRAEIANSGTSCRWCEDTVRKNTIKEFAEKLKKKLFDFFQDNEDLDWKISTGILYSEIIGVDTEDGTIITLGLIDELLKEYEK